MLAEDDANFIKAEVQKLLSEEIIEPSTIRQRLLERDDLTLQNAFEQACTLYRAHEHSNSYGGVLSVTASSF